MLIKRPRGFEIPESQATPEWAFTRRQALVAGLGFTGALALGATGARAETDPSAGLYPVKRNEAFKLDRELTPEKTNASYNNFYEFGSHKYIASEAQALKIRPWTVKIDGLVEKPMDIGFDDLLKAMPLEERLYRHRCVEAWSMTIPWSGFPVAALVKFAKPLSSAKYVRFETFKDLSVASGQRQVWYPWPYVEGLAMDEAMNDLAFLATGAYGKPMAKQHGAPLRLAVPWKYGFKSIKSIVRISFEEKRPESFWETIAGNEYGFWANVNPAVPHPRWSQATERVLHTGEQVPTLLYNGYGDLVAHLYKDRTSEALYM